METKTAEKLVPKAATECKGEEGMPKTLFLKTEERAAFMESAKERLWQLSFSAPPAVEQYWVSLKNKVCAAGEYTTIRTRQGISLFGEPNIGPIKTIVDHC